MKINAAVEFVIALMCSSPLLYTQAISHTSGPVSPSTKEPQTANVGTSDVAPSTEQRLDQPRSREFDQLFALDTKISQAETDGDKTFLDSILAPMLVFRRTDGTIVDRAAFLVNVKPSAKRSVEMESISFFGGHRALVTCVVTMDVNRVEKRFHNLRLFVRGEDITWKLMAWANEEIK
jgi:hypothetical protein